MRFKDNRGFTLVELIVVITILAILATIGFLSLQGYTSDAKDAKVRANIRTVTSALVNEQAMTNNTISTYVDTSNVLAYRIANNGTGSAYSGAYVIDFTYNNGTGSYFVGEIKASALRIDGSKFFDQNSSGVTKPFPIGAYNFSETVNGKTRVRPVFQIAATIKGNSKTAIVEGNYGTGSDIDVPWLIKASLLWAVKSTTAHYNWAVPPALSQYSAVINGSATNYPYDL